MPPRGHPLPPEGARVPLRRLSTKRFRTLAARNEDNARRRASAGVKKDKHNYTDWSDIRDARDEGMTWGEISTILAEQDRLANLYARGLPIGDSGQAFWTGRDTRLPVSIYYYRGIFG